MPVLELERRGTTAVLTLNRPKQRNALDPEMRQAFADVLPLLREDAGIRAVVLTGAGGHFCSGGDVKAIAPSEGEQRDAFEGRDRIRKIHGWFDELVDLEKPVISAVNGTAYGAGVSLALAADAVIASDRASFCCVFARIGYVPDMGLMYLLPRAVGLARAKELVFSARAVNAREALEIGLVQRVVEGDALPHALALAERFAHAPTAAIGLAKGVMNHAFESERRTVYAQEAMAQAICRESGFHQEAVRRFLSKQPPLYQWPEESP